MKLLPEQIDQIFTDDYSYDVMSSPLFEIESREYTKQECRKAFEALPFNVQCLALEWGLVDTEFRDEAYLFFKENPIDI